MTNIHANKSIYYYEVSSQPNVELIGIILYMWKNHNFETIFDYDDVLNIQYFIGKGFGYRDREWSMVVNAYFCPIRTNIPHVTPYYGPGKSNLYID